MSGWWYEAKGKRKGPISTEQLGALLGEGHLDANTFVWRDGMEQWASVCTLPEMEGLISAQPPPLPKPLALFAGLWRRFFARVFDIWVCQLAVIPLIAMLIPGIVPTLAESLNTPHADAVFVLLCVPIALVLDAGVYAMFGNTPGKALLGVRVRNQFGYPLNFFEYVERNIGMWVRGLALGFPIINLFTMWQQATRLKHGQPASYDESSRLAVLASPVGWAHKAAFSAGFLVLAFAMLILNAMDQADQRRAGQVPSEQRGTPAPAVKASSRWRNIHTGREVLVPPGWIVTTGRTSWGAETVTFTEPRKQVEIHFGFEDARVSLAAYVKEYRHLMLWTIRFHNEGEYFSAGNIPAWRGGGAPLKKPQNHADVAIGKFEQGFWRAVLLDKGPAEEADPETRKLLDALWNTVPR